jgi:homotetrameric cytidine deaminase
MQDETIRMLVRKAMDMLVMSYVPYSHFHVGAALLTKSGKVYGGCNIENKAYSPTICAERPAIFKAVSEGEREFERISVVGGKDGRVTSYFVPCGVCRQVMSEFCDDDFLVMTGGKIDMAKQQTVLLMQAVNRLSSPKVKLLVFGSVVPELKDKVLANCSDRVQYIGWIASEQTYAYFSAADLAVFPGRHSVLWEQVAGLGIPMACKYWDGTTHVNVGGNAVFMHEDSADEMLRILSDLTENPEKYRKMKAAAQENGMNVFSYDAIAKRSIEQ